jgi:hypothetical protein
VSELRRVARDAPEIVFITRWQMIFIEVVLGLAWFCTGVSGPIISNINNKDWTIDDAFMLPIAGILGPITLASFLIAYFRQKQKNREERK